MDQVLEMPKYRSRKLIRALKISEVTPLFDVNEKVVMVSVGFEDKRFEGRQFDVRNKPEPSPGWYFIQYEGGYESFCPPDVFEAGNTAMDVVFENAAKAAHQVNRLVLLELGEPMGETWEFLTEAQKASAIDKVRSIWSDPTPSPDMRATSIRSDVFGVVVRAVLGV